MSAGLNILILILPFIIFGLNTTGKSSAIPGWWFPAIISSFVAGSCLYRWAFLLGGRWSISRWAGVYSEIYKHGVDEQPNVSRRCKLCRSHRGTPHRHADYGYLEYLHFTHKLPQSGIRATEDAGEQPGEHVPRSTLMANSLYQLFGGSKDDYHLNLSIGKLLESIFSLPSKIIAYVRPSPRLQPANHLTN